MASGCHSVELNGVEVACYQRDIFFRVSHIGVPAGNYGVGLDLGCAETARGVRVV